MSQAIEFQKTMSEIVYVNLPGPEEPRPDMAGTEMLHGFLAELGTSTNEALKAYVDSLCLKWNVHFRTAKRTR